ncbi:MAG: hypothetical protein ACP5QK_09490 [Myxococcota bacterium]
MSKFWTSFLILITLFISGYFSHFHRDWPNPNETVRLYLALAIVDEGRFNIDKEINTYGVIWDRAVYKGKIYSDKAPGISFAAVPSLYISRLIHKYFFKKTPGLKTQYLIAVYFTSLLFTIISIIFLIRLFNLYNLSHSTILLSIFSIVPGTYVTTYSMLFFGHQFSASLLFIAFVLIEFYIREEKKPVYVISAAFLCSYAFISEYPTLFISILLFLYLLISTRDVKVFLYSSVAIIPVTIIMYYFNSCFGSPISTGYQHLDSETFSKIHSSGILGFKYPDPKAIINLLFGSQRGLFFYSPVLTFAVLYFLKSGLKYSLMRIIFVIFLFYTLLISSFGYWIGGDAAGARHLMPLNYFLIVPLAFFLEENLNKPFALSIFFGLLLISVHNIIVSTISWPFFPPQFLNPIAHFCYILISDGYITHSVANLFGIYGISSIGIYLFIIATIFLLCMVFLLRRFYSGYIIVAEIFIIWILFITMLFPSRPDEENYREIIRIERSFDPKPMMNLPFEFDKRSEYKICLKKGNVLMKRGELIEAIMSYRCIR